MNNKNTEHLCNPWKYQPISYYQSRITSLWKKYKTFVDNGDRMAAIGKISESNSWYNTAKRYWGLLRTTEREMKALQVLNMALEKKKEEAIYYNW